MKRVYFICLLLTKSDFFSTNKVYTILENYVKKYACLPCLTDLISALCELNVFRQRMKGYILDINEIIQEF